MDNQSEYSKLMTDLRYIIQPRRYRQLILLAFAMFVAAILEGIGISAIPLFVSLVISPDRLIAIVPFPWAIEWIESTSQENLLIFGALLLTILFLLKNAYIAALVAFEGSTLRWICYDTASRLFKAYLNGEYERHLTRNASESIRNLTAEIDRFRVLLRTGLMAIREVLVLVMLIAILLVSDPLATLAIILLLGGAGGLYILRVRRRMTYAGNVLKETASGQLQHVTQGLNALNVARTLGRVTYLSNLFEKETLTRENEMYFVRFLTAMPRIILETSAIMSVLVVTLVSIFTDRGAVDILPILSLLAVAIVRMLPAFTAITVAATSVQAGKIAIHAISQDLRLFEKDAPVKVFISPQRNTKKERGHVTITDVSFKFSGTKKTALKNLSLSINPGEAIGVCGPSGAGKSTLANIILGLFNPTAGHIMIDGDPPHKATSLGYIPQDIYLLDDSIRRNICFGLPDNEIDDIRLNSIVKEAQLEEFVASLPKGLDTLVGDDGAQISGGQKQRIGVARALYHDPSVLIIDEGTSALDTETEHALIQSINALNGSRTLIIIAHRLNTLKNCDRILVLKEGKIVQSGNYQTLFGHDNEHSLWLTP